MSSLIGVDVLGNNKHVRAASDEEEPHGHFSLAESEKPDKRGR